MKIRPSASRSCCLGMGVLLLQLSNCIKEPPASSARGVEQSNAARPKAETEKSLAEAKVKTETGVEEKSPASPPVRDDGTVFADSELMGTRVSINVWLEQENQAGQAAQAIRDAFYEIARLEEIASEWQENSEVSQINRNSGTDQFVKVSPELVRILEQSSQVSEATGGLFDVTFYGVGRLWKFAAGSQPPSKSEIQSKLRLVNWKDVEIASNRQGVRLRKKGMAIGLGAIAKGFAVDAASELLRKRGFRHHIVEGGGDTFVSGSKGTKGWKVGIQDPGHRGILGVLPAKDRAIVTSGNYERFFIYKGKRYTHILDPSTGEPLLERSSPQSVTIVAASATQADAYCTGVIVMGRKKGLEFVESRGDLEAVIVDYDGKIYVSSGLRDIFQARVDQMPIKWP